ncbi:MAG: hypothetical protein R3C05_24515 [Pirellulaceae bacterium]
MDGEACGGAEALEVRQMAITHLGLIRCQGIHWILQNLNAVPPEGYGPWSQKASQLNSMMIELLPQFVEAEASRATGSAAFERYHQYLDKLTPKLRAVSDDRLLIACEAALNKTPKVALLRHSPPR